MSLDRLDENEIRYQISQIKELPLLPQSLKRLIEIIHFQVDNCKELECIIGYDPSLVSKILMVANSTYYGHPWKVKSVSKAIALMGVDHVKSICICTLLMNLLSQGRSINEAHRQMLWKHAFSCSRIASEITRKRPWLDGAEAAVLGLVHDLGWIAMASCFSEQFTAICEAAASKNVPLWYVESHYGLGHSQLGKYLAARWALPDDIKAVIEFHHFPDRCNSFKTEVRLIHIANVLSHSREYPEMMSEETTLRHCRDLYISEDEWLDYQDCLETIFTEVDELWNLLGSPQNDIAMLQDENETTGANVSRKNLNEEEGGWTTSSTK